MLKLKVRKVLGSVPTFLEVTEEKLVGGPFWFASILEQDLKMSSWLRQQKGLFRSYVNLNKEILSSTFKQLMSIIFANNCLLINKTSVKHCFFSLLILNCCPFQINFYLKLLLLAHKYANKVQIITKLYGVKSWEKQLSTY